MSHFYGKLKDNGRSTITTKTGHKKYGMSASLKGWDIGADVQIVYDELNKRDVVTCRINRGSNGGFTEYNMRAYLVDGEVIVECKS